MGGSSTVARALHLTVSKSGHSLSTGRGDPLKQPIDCGAAEAVVTRDVTAAYGHVMRVSFEERRDASLRLLAARFLRK